MGAKIGIHQTPGNKLDGSIGGIREKWQPDCPYESIVPIEIRAENGSPNILAEGQLLDGGHRGCGGRHADDHPVPVLLPGEGKFPRFFLYGGLLSSRLGFASDLGRPEAEGAKRSSSADSLSRSNRMGGSRNLRCRLYRAILHCQASLLGPSGRSCPPLRLQLLSCPAILSEMVVPACMSKPAEESGARLIPGCGL